MSKKNHKHNGHADNGKGNQQRSFIPEVNAAEEDIDPPFDANPIPGPVTRHNPVPATQYKRCYESHPALKIMMTASDFNRIVEDQHLSPQGEAPESAQYLIYGGSCFTPIVEDADIYIGFDSGMNVPKTYPWNEVPHGPLKVRFPIIDMHAPDDPAEFKKMIQWIAVQLIAGKKIHCGCIGGHGRTGTVFAALVQYMTGNSDAITYVREHYCQKVVESHAQIEFLHKHYGIDKVKASKGGYDYYPDSKGPTIHSTRSAAAAGKNWWEDHATFGAQSGKSTNGSGKGHTDTAGRSGGSSGYIRDKYAAKGPSSPAVATELQAYPTISPLTIWGPEVVFESFDKQSKPVTITSSPDVPVKV